MKENMNFRIAIKYSREALRRLESKADEGGTVDGMDMIPYLLSKSTLSDEQVLRVISELVFVGVDTVSGSWYILPCASGHTLLSFLNFHIEREHFDS